MRLIELIKKWDVNFSKPKIKVWKHIEIMPNK